MDLGFWLEFNFIIEFSIFCGVTLPSLQKEVHMGTIVCLNEAILCR